MALLKSAWEIALEKTESIKADPEKIRTDALRTEGRRLAGSFLTSDDPESPDPAAAYLACPDADRNYLREGFATTVLMNIAMPQAADYRGRFERMVRLVQLIDGQQSEAIDLMGQIQQFFDQYLAARDKLVERAKQQYQQVFEEKQERLTQKYGRGVDVSMDRDPEFINLVQKGYAQLTAQYQRALDQAKDQLKAQWGLAN